MSNDETPAYTLCTRSLTCGKLDGHEGPCNRTTGEPLVSLKLDRETLTQLFEVLASEDSPGRTFRVSERIRMHLVEVEAERDSARRDGLASAAEFVRGRLAVTQDPAAKRAVEAILSGLLALVEVTT